MIKKFIQTVTSIFSKKQPVVVQPETQKLTQAQQFYKLVQEGALFISFIKRDLEEMKKKQYNRAQRRRFEKGIYGKGELTPDLIEYYQTKVDVILAEIEAKLQKPKTTIQKKDESITK